MAKTKKTPSPSAARERARERRLKLDAERARRDEQIEEAAAEFFEAEDRREELLRQIADVERAMGDAVVKLSGLGESAQRVRTLLDTDARTVRRLQRAAATGDSTAEDAAESTPRSSPDGAPDAFVEAVA